MVKMLIVVLWIVVNLGFSLDICMAYWPPETGITPGYGWYGQQPYSGMQPSYEFGYPSRFWQDHSYMNSNNWQYQPYGYASPSSPLYFNPMFPSGSRGDGAALGGMGPDYQGSRFGFGFWNGWQDSPGPELWN